MLPLARPALLLIALITPLLAGASTLSQQQVSARIQQNLENHLYQLPPRVQGHYGIRLYRMTGDDKYANSALVDLYAVTTSQAWNACQADDPAFIRQAAQLAISKLGNGPRAKARKKALKSFPDFLFYADKLLRPASRMDELGVTGPCHHKLIRILKQQDLRPALTDKTMIRAWAAQLANYVYWAKQIGVGDYRDAYKKAFLATYPESQDGKLSQAQFRNKIYGMTHFIFAASGYYQQPVNAAEFGWILDYFNRHIDKIIADGTPDIIAEVGISFLLTDQADHSVVQKTKSAVMAAFDPKENIIPSPKGNPSLTLGEHRNVLALMLLNWPEKLHRGPLLAKLKVTRKHLPAMVNAKKIDDSAK